MPLYAYRCEACDALTERYWQNTQPPDAVACDACGTERTHRVIGRVACHRSDADKTARLDARYEKMADRAMRNSAGADPDRLLRRMQPMPAGQKPR